MPTIRERNGSYHIEVFLGRDIYGKKIRESITYTPDPALTPKKQKKAAEDFAREFETKLKNGIAMDGRKVTLKEFSDRWLEEYAAQKLEPGTVEKYKDELEKVMPVFGHLKLTELRPANINSFLLSLSKDGARKDGKPGGYAKGSITKTSAVLSSVLRTAVDWELIERNPMDKVRLQADPTADKLKFFTPEQASAFLEFIEKPYIIQTKGHKRIDDTGREYTVGDYEITKEVPEQFRVLFNLAIFSGLRKGVLLALKWSDVDFDTDQIHVTRSVSVVNGQPICKAPKTRNSIRSVTIPHFLSIRMRTLKAAQTRYRLSVGDFWQGEDWVFTQENGKMMNYSTPYHTMHDIITRYNAGKLESEQIPHIPFHGLRHTSATLLIASKQDVRTVSSRLGHAQASTTMNIYAHALKETDRKAANALEEILVKKA